KYAGHLAYQGAIGPQTAGLIEKVAHLSGHVAEARRGAEDDGIVIGQFLGSGDRSLLVPLAACTLAEFFIHRVRDPLYGYLDAITAARTFGDAVCHGLDMAIHGVIKNQYLGHGQSLLGGLSL